MNQGWIRLLSVPGFMLLLNQNPSGSSDRWFVFPEYSDESANSIKRTTRVRSSVLPRPKVFFRRISFNHARSQWALELALSFIACLYDYTGVIPAVGYFAQSFATLRVSVFIFLCPLRKLDRSVSLLKKLLYTFGSRAGGSGIGEI